jgi:hypothetical protein
MILSAQFETYFSDEGKIHTLNNKEIDRQIITLKIFFILYTMSLCIRIRVHKTCIRDSSV